MLVSPYHLDRRFDARLYIFFVERIECWIPSQLALGVTVGLREWKSRSNSNFHAGAKVWLYSPNCVRIAPRHRYVARVKSPANSQRIQNMLEFSREQIDGTDDNNLSTSGRDPKNTSGSISTTRPGAKPSTFEPLRASENSRRGKPLVLRLD